MSIQSILKFWMAFLEQIEKIFFQNQLVALFLEVQSLPKYLNLFLLSKGNIALLFCFLIFLPLSLQSFLFLSSQYLFLLLFLLLLYHLFHQLLSLSFLLLLFFPVFLLFFRQSLLYLLYFVFYLIFCYFLLYCF